MNDPNNKSPQQNIRRTVSTSLNKIGSVGNKRFKMDNITILQNISDEAAYVYYSQLSVERDKEYWFYNVIL
jgi:hypothetical protein